MRTTWLHALAPLCLAPLAPAQSPELVLRVGNSIPGAGHVVEIASVEISDGGTWTALVHTDDPVSDAAVIGSDGIVLKVGQSPPSLGGASFASLRAPTRDLFLFPTYIAGLSGGTSRQAVMTDQLPQFLSGQSATPYASQLPAGSLWRHFDEVQFAWQNSGFLLRASIDDPASGASDRGLLGIAWQSWPGFLTGLDVVALEGDLAPGLARTLAQVRPGPGQARLSGSAQLLIWSCDLDGSGSDDGCVYLSDTTGPVQSTLLAREGSASPVAGRAWGPLEDLGVDVNSLGDWTLRAALDASDPTSDEVLVRSGKVLAREGTPLPVSAPYPLTSLGSGIAAIDQLGRVLWYARWDDPTTPGPDEALLQDGIVVVRTGVTGVAGSSLVAIDSQPGSFAVEPQHGRFVAFLGRLADGTRGLFVKDQGGMEVYCTPKTNSLGKKPAIYWDGQPPSASAGSGFRVAGWFLTAHSPVLPFYGLNGPSAAPFHGGTLCVQPPLSHGPVLDSGGTTLSSGVFAWDFNAWIASGADPALVAGQQVHVQAWFRDRGFPPPDDVGLTTGLSFEIGP